MTMRQWHVTMGSVNGPLQSLKVATKIDKERETERKERGSSSRVEECATQQGRERIVLV